MPTLIKTIGNINNGAVTWNNAAGSAVIGSFTNVGAWTWGPAAGVSTWNTSNGGVVSTRNGSLDGTTTSGSFSSPGVNELTSNFIRTASAGVSVSSAISGYTRIRAESVTSGSSTAFSIETNTANTGVSGANVNGTETNIVSATAAGAWKIGPDTAQVVAHFASGVLSVGHVTTISQTTPTSINITNNTDASGFFYNKQYTSGGATTARVAYAFNSNLNIIGIGTNASSDFVFGAVTYNLGTMTNLTYMNQSGNWNFGAAPGSFGITLTGEHRFYSSIAQTSFGSVDVFDTRTQTTGVGGMISFSGFKIAQTNGAIYAGIKGSKFNATSNNELGQLKFYSSDGSSLKEGGYLDPFSGWVFGLPLGSAQPSFPFKPFIIQTPVSTTAIGFTKFHKISTGTSAVDLVTITSASWDSGHNLVIYVEAFNISTGTYSIVKGIATSNGATASNAINVAATDINNNGLGLGSFAWSAGTGAATLRYTPPTNTDSTVYEITINNRKFPFTLP